MAYPKRWSEIVYFVGTQKRISHSTLETKFNLRYKQSRALIHALRQHKIISDKFNARGEYEVLQKTYVAEQNSKNKKGSK